jgi:hypothetical protein
MGHVQKPTPGGAQLWLCWWQAISQRQERFLDDDRLENQAAMNAFRTGGAHRVAMLKLLNWCNEAAVVHWTHESSDIPVWQEAQQHMEKEGRLSKVNHPSPAQVSNHIPGPEPSRIQRNIKPVLNI